MTSGHLKQYTINKKSKHRCRTSHTTQHHQGGKLTHTPRKKNVGHKSNPTSSTLKLLDTEHCPSKSLRSRLLLHNTVLTAQPLARAPTRARYKRSLFASSQVQQAPSYPRTAPVARWWTAEGQERPQGLRSRLQGAQQPRTFSPEGWRASGADSSTAEEWRRCRVGANRAPTRDMQQNNGTVLNLGDGARGWVR